MAGGVAVMALRREAEAASRPIALLAGDLRAGDADEIVGVDLLAQPRRDRGSRLRDQHRAPRRHTVGRRRGMAEGLVKMAGEEEIDAGIGDLSHRMMRAPG